MPDGTPDTFRFDPKQSGYLQEVNGIVPHTVLIKQPNGVNCSNEGHLGSHSNVDMHALECESCVDHGPQLKDEHDIWSILPLEGIKTTANVFCVILVSRTSSGDPIKSTVFDQLKLTIKNEKQ